MDICVFGYQMEMGIVFQDYVFDCFSVIVDKYFNCVFFLQVIFGKVLVGVFCCDIVIYVMQGFVFKGVGIVQDVYIVFDQVVDKIDKQFCCYKCWINVWYEQSVYVVCEEQVVYMVFVEYDEDEEVIVDLLLVIVEIWVDVFEVMVFDVVMMFDLCNIIVLLFKNVGIGKYNMVYCCGDGLIGWVELF